MSTNASANQVIADADQLPSLPTVSSKGMRPERTADTTENSSRVTDETTEKKSGLLNRRSKLDTEARIASTTDTKKAVDMNENMITSDQVPDILRSRYKSGWNYGKESLPTIKPPNTSTFGQTVISDLASAQSSIGQTDKSDSGASSTETSSSHAGTRSRVSSSGFQQKLGLRAAGRYQSIANRLYGDNFLGSLSNRVPTNMAESSALDPGTASATSSEESQPNMSAMSRTTADDTASSISVSGTNSAPSDGNSKSASSSLHLVYSCTTSKQTTVVRPSLTSDSGDDDDDHDGDDDKDNGIEDDDEDDDDGAGDGGKNSDTAGFAVDPKLGESKWKKDVVRWRQRLVASPPPRRAAHASRRFEDPGKEVGTASTHVMQGPSVESKSAKLCLPDEQASGALRSPELSKHVSFDPFTLSLNAALEGELDVLQSLFSQVALAQFLFQSIWLLFLLILSTRMGIFLLCTLYTFKAVSTISAYSGFHMIMFV